jgi:hypothetical protein
MNTNSLKKHNLTCLSAGRPANRFRKPDTDTDSLTHVETWPYSLYDWYQYVSQHGSSGKMCAVYYPTTKGDHSTSSSHKYKNAGMGSPTEFLTLRISEFPKDAVESTLSDIMITDVPPKYYLSQKCRNGIMKRSKREKVVPKLLLRALQMCTILV